MNFLKEGDIIELDERHMVYVTRSTPMTTMRDGKFVQVPGQRHTETRIKDHPEYKGRYLVIETKMDGGGTAHGPHDVYPDGHHVYCQKIEEINYKRALTVRVDFYQSGCFTCMNTDVKRVGQAVKDTSWRFLWQSS